MNVRPESFRNQLLPIYLGPDQHIRAMISQRVTDADAADWECIRRLDTSARYNLAAKTGQIFARLRPYRSELENVLRSFRKYEDFQTVDLDSLMDGRQM